MQGIPDDLERVRLGPEMVVYIQGGWIQDGSLSNCHECLPIYGPDGPYLVVGWYVCGPYGSYNHWNMKNLWTVRSICYPEYE